MCTWCGLPPPPPPPAHVTHLRSSQMAGLAHQVRSEGGGLMEGGRSGCVDLCCGWVGHLGGVSQGHSAPVLGLGGVRGAVELRGRGLFAGLSVCVAGVFVSFLGRGAAPFVGGRGHCGGRANRGVGGFYRGPPLGVGGVAFRG